MSLYLLPKSSLEALEFIFFNFLILILSRKIYNLSCIADSLTDLSTWASM